MPRLGTNLLFIGALAAVGAADYFLVPRFLHRGHAFQEQCQSLSAGTPRSAVDELVKVHELKLGPVAKSGGFYIYPADNSRRFGCWIVLKDGRIDRADFTLLD